MRALRTAMAAASLLIGAGHANAQHLHLHVTQEPYLMFGGSSAQIINTPPGYSSEGPMPEGYQSSNHHEQQDADMAKLRRDLRACRSVVMYTDAGRVVQAADGCVHGG